MIGKVRGEYAVDYSGYPKPDGPGISDSDLKTNIRFGYVELVGCISPESIKGIDPASPVPSAASSTAAEPGAPVKRIKKKSGKKDPVYEYTWSVAAQGENTGWYWDLDKNDPIVVQLIFHTGASRYHVSEVSASLKQIPPYHKTKSQEIMDWVEMLTPFAGLAGKALEAGGLAGPAKVISTISKMKLNSIPADKFPWYIKTFSAGTEPGVEWHIPHALIALTGNRFVGSVGVTFTDGGALDSAASNSLNIEVRAFLRDTSGKELFLSPTNKPLVLPVKPA